jgi:hypothetical protein
MGGQEPPREHLGDSSTEAAERLERHSVLAAGAILDTPNQARSLGILERLAMKPLPQQLKDVGIESVHVYSPHESVDIERQANPACTGLATADAYLVTTVTW